MVEQQFTYCHLCEQRCGLAVTTEGNKVQKIEPDKDNTYSWRDFCIFWNVRRSTLSFNQSRLNHLPRWVEKSSTCLALCRVNGSSFLGLQAFVWIAWTLSLMSS